MLEDQQTAIPVPQLMFTSAQEHLPVSLTAFPNTIRHIQQLLDVISVTLDSSQWLEPLLTVSLHTLALPIMLLTALLGIQLTINVRLVTLGMR